MLTIIISVIKKCVSETQEFSHDMDAGREHRTIKPKAIYNPECCKAISTCLPQNIHCVLSQAAIEPLSKHQFGARDGRECPACTQYVCVCLSARFFPQTTIALCRPRDLGEKLEGFPVSQYWYLY